MPCLCRRRPRVWYGIPCPTKRRWSLRVHKGGTLARIVGVRIAQPFIKLRAHQFLMMELLQLPLDRVRQWDVDRIDTDIQDLRIIIQ